MAYLRPLEASDLWQQWILNSFSVFPKFKSALDAILWSQWCVDSDDEDALQVTLLESSGEKWSLHKVELHRFF